MIRAHLLSGIMIRPVLLILIAALLTACQSLPDRASREFNLAVNHMIVTDTVVTARADAPWDAAFTLSKPVTSLRFPAADEGLDRPQNWAVITPAGAPRGTWSVEDGHDVIHFDRPVDAVTFQISFNTQTLKSGRWGARPLEGGQFAIAESQFLARDARLPSGAKAAPRRVLQTVHFEPGDYGSVMAHGKLYDGRYTLGLLERADEYLIFGAKNDAAIGSVQPYFSGDFPLWMREALSKRLPDISAYF